MIQTIMEEILSHPLRWICSKFNQYWSIGKGLGL